MVELFIKSFILRFVFGPFKKVTSSKLPKSSIYSIWKACDSAVLVTTYNSSSNSYCKGKGSYNLIKTEYCWFSSLRGGIDNWVFTPIWYSFSPNEI